MSEALNRRIGLGFTLDVDPNGGTTFQNIGAILDGWDEGEAKAEVTDNSILADTYKQKGKSQIDPGEVTFEIAYDPDGPSSSLIGGMLKQVNQSIIPNWRINYPPGSTGSGATGNEQFLALLVGQGRTVKKGKLTVAKITLAKSGNPGFKNS